MPVISAKKTTVNKGLSIVILKTGMHVYFMLPLVPSSSFQWLPFIATHLQLLPRYWLAN